jgi:hypothetical protein
MAGVVVERIEMRGVDELTAYARNSRTHSQQQVAQIATSINEFGFVNPIIIGGDNEIIAGHGRLMAAISIGMASVPVLVVDHLTDAQRRAYIIADNQLALNAGWDADLLSSELANLMDDGFDISVVGFSDDELSSLLDLDDDERQDIDVDENVDAKEELQLKWKTAIGQVWKIGVHTLNINDCASVVFPEGDIFFDPPWEMISSCYSPVGDSVLAFCDGQRAADVIDRYGAPTWVFVWDCVTSWYAPNRPLKRSKLCLWYGDVENYDFNGSHYGDAGEVRTVGNTRGSYEFIPDSRGKHLSDVFSKPITQLHKDSLHSHSKPIDWIRMLIANCTSGVVIDPYAGSGSCMAACEQIGRECFSVEMCPKYAAVILENMAGMGISPVLVNG